MATASHSSSAQPLSFSSDIFCNILLFTGLKLHDLTYTWTTFREVSHAFKDAVEHIFITRHLTKTWIRLYTSFEFEFIHLDAQDSGRAVFRVHGIRDECKESREAELRVMLRRLKEDGVSIHRPRIIVQVRGYPDDTYIPGLEFYPDALEISLDWKGMYSEYFKEEKERSRRLGQSVENMRGAILEKREKVVRGLLGEMDLFQWGLEQFADNFKGGRLEVRAERIAKNMRKLRGVDNWSDRDEAGYRALNDICVAASWEDPYSDEEEEEARKEDDEDDEDAWEDVDDEDDEDVDG